MQPLDGAAVVESPIDEERRNVERKGRDAVDDTIDRIAFRLIAADSRDGQNERFRSTERERREVAMAPGVVCAKYGYSQRLLVS